MKGFLELCCIFHSITSAHVWFYGESEVPSISLKRVDVFLS